jgi:hypothetical protein
MYWGLSGCTTCFRSFQFLSTCVRLRVAKKSSVSRDFFHQANPRPHAVCVFVYVCVCVCVCVCMCMYVCVCMCVSSKTASPLYLIKALHDTLVSQRCSRDCSGVLVVASLQGAQGLLSRFDCVYSGYITQGCAGGALVGWWWHHSRRRRDCSHALTACIQATSLKGAQGVLWRVAMSLRARCFFSPAHQHICHRRLVVPMDDSRWIFSE